MWDNISQVVILLTGLPALFLLARKNRWGFVLGLIGAPFWLITTYVHEQWGLFFLNFLYMVNWIYGIHCWFFKKQITITTESAESPDPS